MQCGPASEKNKNISYDIRDLTTDDDDKDYHLVTGIPFIEFTSGEKKDYEDKGIAFRIQIAQYLGKYDVIERETYAHFQMSKHAQFEEIIEYVRKSGAKQIIVENTRTEQAIKLENGLRQNGFNAICRPKPVFNKNVK